MTSEYIWQRSDLLNTQVITRDTGKRLGVVSEVLVDIDRREVVALGLRESLISRIVPGVPQYMLLNQIRQVGDVILVDDDRVLDQEVAVESYSRLIASEVITETGELLGKVRGFKFDIESGKVQSLILASIGMPMIPDQIVSTYELPIEEIVSSGPDRLIVFEGAEEHLVQITVGVLERLGISAPPWEREFEEDYSVPTVPTENQLGRGTPLQAPAQPYRARTPVAEEATWDDDNWGQPEPEPVQRRAIAQPEPRYYQEEVEEDNWSEASGRETYYDRGYDASPSRKEVNYVEEYEEMMEEDAWADTKSSDPYNPPRVNIPKKTKAPEYEEEPGY